MRILVNASTIIIGGGIQNTLSFVTEALRDDSEHEWHLAISEGLANELKREFPEEAAKAHVFLNTPSRDWAGRRRLQAIEAQIKPDCVFTYNGPAYAKFRAPHLLGFATPWVTHPTWLAYRTTQMPVNWIEKLLKSRYRARWFRLAETWVTETNVSKTGLARRLRLDPSKVFVVPNSCGPLYFGSREQRPFPTQGGLVRLLCFAAAHSHKRLEFLPYVAKELALRCPDLNFEFVITLPECGILRKVLRSAAKLNVLARLKNEGPIPVADGPKLYRSCDVCFMPTVLETSTATYPEAMAMGLPIVTTNLPFATDVCCDAALYFDPTSAASAADCIQRVLRDEALWRDLIAKGKAVVSTLPSPRQKYDAYMQILTGMIQGKDAAQPTMSRS
jgi:glycosyltransferase involved in cell wall biosynthesis